MRLVFRLAMQSLVHGRRRAWFLAVSLGAAAFFMVLVVSVFDGMRRRLLDAGTAMHAGHVNISGVERSPTGRTISVLRDAETVAATVVQDLPGEPLAVVRVLSRLKLVGEAGALHVRAWGIDSRRETRLFAAIEAASAGDARLQPELLAERGALLMFEREAEKLHLAVGDRVTLMARTIRGAVNTTDVEVAAIAEDMGGLSDGLIFVERDTLRRLLGLPSDAAQRIFVYLDEPSRAELVRQEIHEFLRAGGHELMPYAGAPVAAAGELAGRQEWQGRRLILSTWQGDLGFFLWRLGAAAGISAFLFVILALVIGVGVANSMLVAVRLRTREIGTLRALGLSRVRVVFLFVLEGLLLGAAAAGSGALLGAAAAMGLDVLGIPIGSAAFRDIYLSSTLRFEVRPNSIAFAAVGIALVSAMSCIWPALRAARLSPVEAVRVEN